MATAQFQLSGRKALAPKNTKEDTNSQGVKSNSKPKHEQIGKENLNMNLTCHPLSTPTKTVEAEAEALDTDSSLAEELSAIRKKLERMRLDKENTEKMLNEREAMLSFQMKELDERGQVQKLLEIEVDRLFRLKELKSHCLRISPIKSLRERQLEDKRIRGGKYLEIKAVESEEESMDENTLQSPVPSDSSEAVQENTDD